MIKDFFSIGIAARRGFTLIEILVVIAVIALLIALLLPALGTARETARQTACLSNIKQLQVASHGYVNDYRETLPGTNGYGSSSQPGWLYAGYQPGYMWLDSSSVGPTLVGPSTGQLWAYLGGNNFAEGVQNGLRSITAKVYRCLTHHTPYSGTDHATSYVFNNAINGYGRYAVSCKISSITRTNAVMLWEADENGGRLTHAPWNDGGSSPDEGRTSRHGDGATMGAFDGSASWWTNHMIDEELAGSTRKLLWCVPDSPNGR